MEPVKPVTAVREYYYWSERLVTKLWQDNVSQLRNKLKLGVKIPPGVTLETQDQDPLQTRAAHAVVIEALLADHIVTDPDYDGPLSYLARRSQMVLSSLRDDQGNDTGAVTLFADLQSPQGRRIAVCLFGSANNVCGCEPTVPAWRQFGWTSSTNNGVKFLLSAAANAESSKDPEAFWRQAAEEARTDDAEICWNALNICHGAGTKNYGDCRPWHRGYVIGHYQDGVEWLARIYFTDRDLTVPGPAAFDEVHVGAAFWVRSGSARAWVPYNRENTCALDEADRLPRRRSLARIWREPREQDRGQYLVYKPYPELSSPAQNPE
jgi:hypothetical protein